MFLFSENQPQGQMPKKSHEENLATVCCVCGRKGRQFQNVSENMAQKVRIPGPTQTAAAVFVKLEACV